MQKINEAHLNMKPVCFTLRILAANSLEASIVVDAYRSMLENMQLYMTKWLLRLHAVVQSYLARCIWKQIGISRFCLYGAAINVFHSIRPNGTFPRSIWRYVLFKKLVFSILNLQINSVGFLATTWITLR